ncbi:MAG: methylenetetrahydrofolate reductase [Micrococcales bacterium]
MFESDANSSAAKPAGGIVDLLDRHDQSGKPTLSFEFFPPKDADGEASLWRNFDKLLEASPDFVSVTYGAGGSNRETSLAVVDRMAKAVPTIGHLTCVGTTRAATLDIIRHFEAAGVAALLALRGDPQKDSPAANSELSRAIDLVELIREVTTLDAGVAAFPEVHPESPDLAHDVRVLKLKQDAGASFAMTQLFFSVEAYTELVAAAHLAGVTMPIVPGVMPISNAARVLRMAEMSGASVPARLLAQLQSADEVEARRIGMDYSIELSHSLLAAGAPGLHIFTLNFSKAAIEVAKGAGLA